MLAGPDSVTITARGTGTLTATWTAVPGAHRYFIYTSNSSDDWKTFTSEDAVTGTSVTLDNRDDLLNYTVLVHASAELGYTTWTESYPAGTLNSIPIEPESVSVSRSGTTLTATWPAVVGAASYNVSSSADNGVTWTKEITGYTTTTWKKSSISASTSYIVRVQTKNTSGTSGWTVSDANTPKPPAPASVTVTSRSHTGTNATLAISWDAVTRATGYNIRSSGDNGATWTTDVSSHPLTTLSLTLTDNTKDYFIGVQAVNSAGTSDWTNSSISRATPLPPAPANLTATRAKGSITLTWDAATGAATYDIACSLSSGYTWDDCKKGVTDAQRSAGVTFTQIYNPTANATQPIADRRDYYFAVRGRNTSGAGEWTRVTAWMATPEQIASVTATSRDADSITLSMTVPPANGGYSVTKMHVDCRTSSNGGTSWSGWFICTNAETRANPVGGSTFTAEIDSGDSYDSTLTYQARARARNALGHAWDWRESAAIPTVPGAPTIVSYASDTLTWNKPSDTGSGSSALTYNVYCRANAGAAWTKVVNGVTVPTGTPPHTTSLSTHSTCTGTTSQVEISVVNGFESARVRYSPITFTAGSIGTTTATLTIANHGLTNWYAKETSPATNATCSSAISGTTRSLSSLTAGTWYTYRAYSDSACSDANEIGAVAFSTAVTVSNLSEALNGSNSLLVNSSNAWAQEFTAGSAATLSSVTLNFAGVYSASNISVTLRDRQSNGTPNTTTTLATLSGTPGSGNSAFTCSGSGCELANGAKYFIHVSGSGSFDAYIGVTTSDAQTLEPSGNGWSIADAALEGPSWSSHSAGVSMKIKMTAAPKLSFTHSSVTATTATLTLNGHTGDWWLKRTTPSNGTCAAGEADFSHALSSLNSGTTYTYKAYSDSACSTEIASETFTTAAVDYDTDNDRLIEITTLAQLNAARWDLDGNGQVTGSNQSNYRSVFPDASYTGATAMGCPSSGCQGYELSNDLDFDTNGNNIADSGDTYWNGGAGWTPIGDYTTAFTATFEGNSYKLSNLYVNASTTAEDSAADIGGLFGVVGKGGAVKNLGSGGCVRHRQQHTGGRDIRRRSRGGEPGNDHRRLVQRQRDGKHAERLPPQAHGAKRGVDWWAAMTKGGSGNSAYEGVIRASYSTASRYQQGYFQRR